MLNILDEEGPALDDPGWRAQGGSRTVPTG
jgi:hypothetical protein